MILLNLMVKTANYSKETAKAFIQLLNPMAPHIAEELWDRLGGSGSISDAPWPSFDETKLILSEVKIVVQVNGKHRGEILIPTDTDKETVEALGLSQERVKNSIEGKTVRKVIYVPGKILNIVAY
jgi:leucyl-tRNA synthetase